MSGNGTAHFMQQRLTAMANVPLVLFLLWFIVMHLGTSRVDVVGSIGNPVVGFLLVASMASILWHMWLGMQVIIEDYMHDAGSLKLSMMLNTLFVAALGAASLYAIAKMSFGF